MATRNPVSVLPEPVGEATRTSLPAAMWGQAADWGGVGPAGNRRANQPATAGWKSDSGERIGQRASGTLLFHQDGVTVAAAPPAAGGRSAAGPVRRGRSATPAGDHRRLGQVQRAGGHVGQVQVDLVLGGDAVLEELVRGSG